MGKSVYVKANDDKRRILDTLLLDGTPLDLTSASVVCCLRSVDTGINWRRTASIDTPATSGKVYYDLTSTDLAIATRLMQEWEVTTSASKVITYPADGYNEVIVVGDLGN